MNNVVSMYANKHQLKHLVRIGHTGIEILKPRTLPGKLPLNMP